MDRKVAFAIVAIAILILLLIFIRFKPVSEPGPTPPIVPQPPMPPPLPSVLTIENFQFSEVSEGSDNFTARFGDGNKIIFEGPVQKPTPCNGLAASYRIETEGEVNRVIVEIEATPYEGFCIQVIANTFYEGSFEFSGGFVDELVVLDPFGEEIGREGFIRLQPVR